MLRRLPVLLLLIPAFCFAGVVDDVRDALDQNDFTHARIELDRYHAEHGDTPEYAEAVSWMARSALSANQLDAAATYARQAESAVKRQIAHQPLDTEPHLPIALGAAYEVQARVLAARKKQAAAATLLRQALDAYGKTSIHARLQKNLNLLGLVGQPAPALAITQYLGTARPVALTQLKGSPVLLFFWAHWCPDCKAEAPIITRLRADFGDKGFTLVAPTQLYGYAAGGEDASPQVELPYIARVWQRFYPALQDIPVPVSKANFNAYGASTTPTLVLLDRSGHVVLYHPGAMTYQELHAAIEKILR